MLIRRAYALFALVASNTVSAASLKDVLANTKNVTMLNDLLNNQFPDIFQQIQDSSDITFLAPSDIAFGRIPYTDVLGQAFNANDSAEIANIFDYHVLPGQHPSSSLNQNGSFQFLPTMLTDRNWTSVTGGQRVGAVLQGNNPPTVVFTSGLSTRSVVAQQDIEFDGGIIHVIDAFAIPPMPYVYTADQYNLAYEQESILSFLGAVYSQPSNLTLGKILNNTADLTLFVPSNIAMELVSGTLESMSPAALQNLLSYHIVPSPNGYGPVYTADFINGTRLTTMQGNNVTLLYTWNSYFVNSARVVASDILIGNGVMHVIDNVLAPSVTSAVPDPTTYTQMPVLPTTFSGSESFNSSAAPFTSFVPNVYVSSVSSSDNGSASATDNGGAGSLATSGAPTASSVSESSSSRSGSAQSVHHGEGGRLLSIVVSLVGAVALGGCLLL